MSSPAVIQARLMAAQSEVFPLPYRLDFNYADWPTAIAAYEAVGFSITELGIDPGIPAVYPAVEVWSSWAGPASLDVGNAASGESQVKYLFIIADEYPIPMDLVFTLPTTMSAYSVSYDATSVQLDSAYEVRCLLADGSTNVRTVSGAPSALVDFVKYTDGPFASKIVSITFRYLDSLYRKFLTNIDLSA